MKIDGKPYRSIWREPGRRAVNIIDQTALPHRLEIRELEDLEAAAEAIETMRVRGAPLIGATAAYGLALALDHQAEDEALKQASKRLSATRPTAVNLRHAVDSVIEVVRELGVHERADAAWRTADAICELDVSANERIGSFGLSYLEELFASKKRPGPLKILTHCNAGWLATVDWGTALAPVYKAYDSGLDVFVWVDETRPRNQGASLTAFELLEHGVDHAVIVDNAGGHLMQKGEVDIVIVGTDRTTSTGDVCNKIGTYLKALAAADNEVPFVVALPYSTIDWQLTDGVESIPIEERDAGEVRFARGLDREGRISEVELFRAGSPAVNPAFDVTPARLVTKLLTEFGPCEATAEGLEALRYRVDGARDD